MAGCMVTVRVHLQTPNPRATNPLCPASHEIVPRLADLYNQTNKIIPTSVYRERIGLIETVRENITEILVLVVQFIRHFSGFPSKKNRFKVKQILCIRGTLVLFDGTDENRGKNLVSPE